MTALRKRYDAEVRNSLIGSAMVCATLANIHRDEKKRKKPISFEDFLPGTESQAPARRTKQSAEDMLRHVRSVQADVHQANSQISAARKRKR